MNNPIITNISKLVVEISRFESFVQSKDGRSLISFRDTTGFLGREEDYKSQIAEAARKALDINSWKESWIGTGKIADCAKKMMGRANNLVYMNQQVDFRNRLDPNHPSFRHDAEQVLYDIYKNSLIEDEVNFQKAIDVFGAKYPTIAFLFFVKDDSRFLPISPRRFDKSFQLLDIDYTTSYSCSWENYKGYIDIIKEIRNVLEQTLYMEGVPRLIDAHSFVWVIQEDRFVDWQHTYEQSEAIECNTEGLLDAVVSGKGGKRNASVSAPYARSSAVSKETRRRAKGICQYCQQPAPFNDDKGDPYLEVHHVIWLSREGEDSTENTVALCPNCHRRMHVLDREEDIEKLIAVIKQK